MKRIFLSFICSVIFLSPFIAFSEETVDQVLAKIFDKQFGTGFQVVVELTSNENLPMEITALGKINRNSSNLLIIFNKPDSSKGMKLLSINTKDQAPLLYVYMPGPGQSFQLDGESLNMPIGDTEATLGDLIPMVGWDGTHVLLGTEKCEDETCYLIETQRDWEKGKRIAKIGMSTLLSHSIEQFDTNETLVKTIETLETRIIDGRERAIALRISGHRTQGGETRVTFLSGNMDADIPDTIFTPEMMKQSYKELMHLGEDVL